MWHAGDTLPINNKYINIKISYFSVNILIKVVRNTLLSVIIDDE